MRTVIIIPPATVCHERCTLNISQILRNIIIHKYKDNISYCDKWYIFIIWRFLIGLIIFPDRLLQELKYYSGLLMYNI